MNLNMNCSPLEITMESMSNYFVRVLVHHFLGASDIQKSHLHLVVQPISGLG